MILPAVYREWGAREPEARWIRARCDATGCGGTAPNPGGNARPTAWHCKGRAQAARGANPPRTTDFHGGPAAGVAGGTRPGGDCVAKSDSGWAAAPGTVMLHRRAAHRFQ